MAAQFNQMPTKVTTQLNQTLSKVKSNIKQAQTDFNQIDVTETIRTKLEKVKVPELISENRIDVQQLVEPVKQRLQTSNSPKDIFQSMKNNTTQMVSRLQQKLPDKEKVLSRMAQAGQKLKDDNPFKDLFKKSPAEALPID